MCRVYRGASLMGAEPGIAPQSEYAHGGRTRHAGSCHRVDHLARPCRPAAALEDAVSVHVQKFYPSHPNASASGMVYEHVLVAERALGRFMPAGAEIHHVDGNPRNNSASNLVICQDKAYHKHLHYRSSVLARGANPSTHRYCSRCDQFKVFADFNRMSANKSNGLQRICRECSRDVDTERRSRGAK